MEVNFIHRIEIIYTYLFIFPGYKIPLLYEEYPELEMVAKLFVVDEFQKKSCNFRVLDLWNFFDAQFYEISGELKEFPDLIRSETTVRDDLKRWGVQFGNVKSIYFEGHERRDVIVDCELFVDYFMFRKENYNRYDNKIKLIEPIEHPCVLMFHDESTF